MEDQRHVMNKVQYRKNNVQQVLDERNDAIHQLLTTASHTNKKVIRSAWRRKLMDVYDWIQIHDCKNEIAHQRLERDQNEMKQLKLRRTLGQLQNTKEIPVTKVSSSARAKFIEQVDPSLQSIRHLSLSLFYASTTRAYHNWKPSAKRNLRRVMEISNDWKDCSPMKFTVNPSMSMTALPSSHRRRRLCLGNT